MARPVGVTILAVIAAIYGVFYLFMGLSIMFVGGVSTVFLGPLGALGVAAGFIVLLLGVLDLAAAYGLWKLREWGRMISVILAGISLIMSLFAVLVGEFVGNGLNLLVSALILWYLTRPATKGYFRGGTGVPPTLMAA